MAVLGREDRRRRASALDWHVPAETARAEATAPVERVHQQQVTESHGGHELTTDNLQPATSPHAVDAHESHEAHAAPDPNLPSLWEHMSGREGP